MTPEEYDAEEAADRAEQIAEEGDPAGVENPYDEDDECRWCGNGSWKHHMPVCAWADLRDGLGEREVGRDHPGLNEPRQEAS